MDRVRCGSRAIADRGLFDADEVLLVGRRIGDLRSRRDAPHAQARPAGRGLLRSGCYVTHDHGPTAATQRASRRGSAARGASSLRPALEVWTAGAVLPRAGAGDPRRRAGATSPSTSRCRCRSRARARRRARRTRACPRAGRSPASNDQHAHLRWDAADAAQAPEVGERIGLGISHPCTTFDKWHWMPLVDERLRRRRRGRDCTSEPSRHESEPWASATRGAGPRPGARLRGGRSCR